MAVTNKSETQKSSRDLWETDPRVVRWLENHLGFQFELDACGSLINRKAPLVCIKDARFYHDRHLLPKLGAYWDGMAQPWHKLGNAGFLNPPFSEKEKFYAKAEREARLGMTVVAALPVAMATGWWMEVEQGAERIIQPDKRINYIHPITGRLIGGVSFETAFAIYRPRREVLIERVRLAL